MSIVTENKFSQSPVDQATKTAARRRFLCHCLKVTPDEVQECITTDSAETVHDVMRSCGAGKGCTACHCRIKDLLAGLCNDCGESNRRCLCTAAVE